MYHICLLYADQDGSDWQRYFVNLLGKSKLRYISLSIQDDVHALQKAFAECSVVVLIMTITLSDFLSNRENAICDILNKHQSIAVILWPSLEPEMETLQPYYSNISSWRRLLSSGSAKDNEKIIADLAGVVDEHEKSKRKRRKKTRTIQIIPDRVHKANETIAVIFTNETKGTVQIGLGEGGQLIDTRKENNFTYTFKAPLHAFGVTKLSIYIDNEVVHSCPFTYQSPSLEAFRSISFLAQAIGVTRENADELDRKLTQIYEESMPTDLVLHQCVAKYLSINKVSRSEYGIPTLLHFAAQYGLTELCYMVLDTPGSLAAFSIENKDGLNPAEIAEKEGYEELAEFIRMFVETAAVIEATDEIYEKMTGSHLYLNPSQENKDEYSEEKISSHPPKKKLPPIPKKLPSSKRPPDRVSIKETIVEEEPEDLSPPPRDPLANSQRHKSRSHSLDEGKNAHGLLQPEQRSHSLDDDEKEAALQNKDQMSPAEFMGMSGTKLSFDISPGSLGSCAQDELVQIQRGVVENEFSIDDAERLYSAWKLRNRDCTKSVKERHKGLSEMREMYSSAFSQVQGHDRTSFFDRLKSKFVRKTSQEEPQYGSTVSIKHTTYESVANIGRMSASRDSTISSSSTSSSGSRDSRMSVSSQDSVIQETESESEEEEHVSRRGKSKDKQKTPIINKHLDVQRGKNIYSVAKRLSYRDHYLQQSASSDLDEPPPIPSRAGRPNLK